MSRRDSISQQKQTQIMITLPGGCLLFDSQDGRVTKHGNCTSLLRIGRATGAKHVSQVVNSYTEGRSATVINPSSEEVLYVVDGEGCCHVNGFPYDLRPGMGVFVPPGAEYSIENRSATALVIVSACCPEDPNRSVRDEPLTAALGERPQLTVHSAQREKLPATAGREFCLMVDKDLGCQQVTQFVGWIPPSTAPFHFHTYEEVIFILAGSGILHVEDESSPFTPGSSIYLPIRVRHCLENPGPAPLRLLGVFYPSGSPAAAYNVDSRSA